MSKSHTEQGEILLVEDTKSYGAKGFQKREVVLTLDPDGKYPNHVPFTLTRDNCALADDLVEGQTVTVHFNVKGNYYEKGDRYFGSNEVWKIDAGEKPVAVPAGDAAAPEPLTDGELGHEGGGGGDADGFPFLPMVSL